MASFKLSLLIFVFLDAILLLFNPVSCDDERDNLLQGINSYRKSHSLPAITKNDNANCIAEEIADKIQDQPCPRTGATTTLPQFSDYPNALKKCKLDINTTRDGVIVPVCVPKRLATLVLTNFTQSPYTRYLNGSVYTGAGIGLEDDWTVLVLTTNTPGGSFVSGASLGCVLWVSYYVVTLFWGWWCFLL